MRMSTARAPVFLPASATRGGWSEALSRARAIGVDQGSVRRGASTDVCAVRWRPLTKMPRLILDRGAAPYGDVPAPPLLHGSQRPRARQDQPPARPTTRMARARPIHDPPGSTVGGISPAVPRTSRYARKPQDTAQRVSDVPTRILEPPASPRASVLRPDKCASARRKARCSRTFGPLRIERSAGAAKRRRVVVTMTHVRGGSRPSGQGLTARLPITRLPCPRSRTRARAAQALPITRSSVLAVSQQRPTDGQ